MFDTGTYFHVRTRFVEVQHSASRIVLTLPLNFVSSSETERIFHISPVTLSRLPSQTISECVDITEHCKEVWLTDLDHIVGAVHIVRWWESATGPDGTDKQWILRKSASNPPSTTSGWLRYSAPKYLRPLHILTSFTFIWRYSWHLWAQTSARRSTEYFWNCQESCSSSAALVSTPLLSVTAEATLPSSTSLSEIEETSGSSENSWRNQERWTVVLCSLCSLFYVLKFCRGTGSGRKIWVTNVSFFFFPRVSGSFSGSFRNWQEWRYINTWLDMMYVRGVCVRWDLWDGILIRTIREMWKRAQINTYIVETEDYWERSREEYLRRGDDKSGSTFWCRRVFYKTELTVILKMSQRIPGRHFLLKYFSCLGNI